MKKEIICTVCPRGCHIMAEGEGETILSLEGFACKRGETYAHQECIAPARMVTAAVPVSDRRTPVSVKTRTPIPKEQIFACMKQLSALRLQAPVRMGDVVLADVCGTGVDVIATKTVE